MPQVSPEKLNTALLTRTIETVGEKITKPLSPESAAESRDAFAKTLYGALFDWLVAAVKRRIATLGSPPPLPLRLLNLVLLLCATLLLRLLLLPSIALCPLSSS